MLDMESEYGSSLICWFEKTPFHHILNVVTIWRRTPGIVPFVNKQRVIKKNKESFLVIHERQDGWNETPNTTKEDKASKHLEDSNSEHFSIEAVTIHTSANHNTQRSKEKVKEENTKSLVLVNIRYSCPTMYYSLKNSIYLWSSFFFGAFIGMAFCWTGWTTWTGWTGWAVWTI